ncbi:MAG: amidohydrolase [Eubacteriales bacterium]|nr:amidohydrolase [Eubacteriales bacterium]
METLLSKVRTYRRELHQIPELELALPKTEAYIRKVLSALPCRLLSPIPSSVCAFFDNGKDETIAFRSDMDALPVTEESGNGFQSLHPGCMHACGHDGHMAMLLGFAGELAAYYRELPHNVMLIFQPGEENPGGAELICKTGFLSEYHITRIFGFHLWPNLPAGTVATRRKEFMARSSEVNIEIEGKSSHAAKYREGIDALEISARYLLDVYRMEAELPKETCRLLRFGHLTSGSIRNVVSSHTRLEGTLRAFQDETYWYLRDQLAALAKPYEETLGAKFHFDINTGYPAVINDEALTERVLSAFPGIQELPEPEMISEDFAHYQKYVPGVFFFLGTGTGIPLHSSHFDFDEEILLKGIETDIKLSRLA